jgi:hypothetical protein
MKACDIVVHGRYLARVSGRIVRVRVDRIYDGSNGRKRYDVTNMATGRTTSFRSATRFRHIAS